MKTFAPIEPLVASVPTLSETGLIVMIGISAIVGAIVLWKRLSPKENRQ